MSQRPRSAEIHPGPGFRVRTVYPRLEPDIIAELGGFDTPDISDQLNRLYAVDPSISCMTGNDQKLCATVCTVKVFPGDNLMVHKSLDIARPGDVVVVNSGGSRSNAVLGDIICTKARHRGLAGFVIDGLIRDLPRILELDFPVFARGTTPIGPLHRGPGEINYPIACGGVVVNPGDVLVADSAGIVVVPQGIVVELLRRLNQQAVSSAGYLAAVKRGEFSNAWVDDTLAQNQCVFDTGEPKKEGAALGSTVAEAVATPQ
jgi:RraA family protein